MKLELGTFIVKNAVFSDETHLKNHILSINRQELKELLIQDLDFEDIQINIARPGEEVRIIHAIDIVEPRSKISGGTIFPGILGPPHTVGQGRTHRLSGMAVIETSEPVAGEPTHWREAIIDMSDPGSLYSPFAKTVNLILTCKPKTPLIAEINDSRAPSTVDSGKFADYINSVRIAGFKASAYLAQVTKEMEPDWLDTYELTSIDSSLPKVAIAYPLFHCVLYGENTDTHLATMIHPNEFMDGALINNYNSPAAKRDSTYFKINNPVISELYSRHGKDLNFIGVILYNTAITKHVGQDRVANYAAKLATLLGVEGVVLPGGSHAYNGAVLMRLCQILEKNGIKTVIISPEMSDSPGDAGFTNYVPEAVAMISTGNYQEKISLPPVKKVIGGYNILETDEDAASSLTVPIRYLYGATNHSGFDKLVSKQY